MKTSQIILLSFFILLHHSAFTQKHNVYMNWDFEDGEKKKVFELWKQYLTQTDHVDTLWCLSDRSNYKGVDLLKSNLGFNGGLYKFKFDCNVLSITQMGDNYLIKSALYFNLQDSIIKDKFELLAVVLVIAKKESHGYKLSNYINYSTSNWNLKTVGRIKYHYPGIYPFDIYNAQKANIFLDSLEQWFKVKVDTINYYIPINCSDGLKMAGFEFYQLEGQNINLCGFYDNLNNIVYSNAILGECYKHELTHQINNVFPNANPIILAGIAAYIDDAGQSGKSERFHLRRYMLYLKKNPTDLNKFYDINYVDDVTAPIYIYGAVICNALLNKGGIKLLKKAMENTRTNDQLVSFLKTTFNIDDFNSFFNREFKVFLAQKNVYLTTESN